MRVAVALSAVVYFTIFFLPGSVTAAETRTHTQDHERIARLPGAAHAKGKGSAASAAPIADITDSVRAHQAQSTPPRLPAFARH